MTSLTMTEAPPAPGVRAEPPVALLVTSDAALRQQITDLARAQHLTITTATRRRRLGRLRRAWTAAPLVLLGADELPACRRAGLPRRPGAIVVASTAPHDPDTVRRAAEPLGARYLAVLPGAWTWLANQLAHPPPAPADSRAADLAA